MEDRQPLEAENSLQLTASKENGTFSLELEQNSANILNFEVDSPHSLQKGM